jgi:hypothetical protein
MTKTLKPPILSHGKCSVMQADVNTGHVLQISGELYLGKGEVYKTFESLILAKKYVDSAISENEMFEFVIYNSKGNSIFYKSKFETKELE